MADRKLILATEAMGAQAGSVAPHLPRRGQAENTPRPLKFLQSGPYFAAMFLIALVAFWPSYLSQIFSASSYTHFHPFLAALWMLMLVAQPMLIRAKRLAWHRLNGRISYVLAALLIISIVLLAHSRISGVGGEAYAVQTYILYLQASLTLLFGLSYALAIYKRRVVALHARFMVCSALTMIDPVVIRLLLWIDRTPDWNYQWLTFGLTDLVLVALIWLERHSRAGRKVFPGMLVVFVLLQVPALFGFTQSPLWQPFARWCAALSLT